MIEMMERPITKKVFEEQYVDIYPHKKIYYAHSMHIYNTPQELRDIELLTKMGYEVINPNKSKTQAEYDDYVMINGKNDSMKYFEYLIDKCDLLAYRSHVDLKIPSGVGYEIKYAIEKEKLIFELPTLVSERFLSLDDTRAYLRYNGQR